VKAFARIGLLVYPKVRIGTRERAPNEIDIVSTLEGNEMVLSRRSRIESLSKLTVAVTRHTQELADFLERYDHRPLIRLLKDFRKNSEEYEIMTKLPVGNIDEIDSDDSTIHRGIKRYLTLKSKETKRTKSVGLS
jgi:hypothetical protein